MIVKKIAAAAAALCVFFTLAAYGSAEERNLADLSDSGVITISGQTGELPETPVTYIIAKPGKSIDGELTQETFAAAVEDIYQGKVAADKSFLYQYALPLDAVSGKYAVYANVYGENTRREGFVIYSNKERIAAAAEKINNGDKVSEVLNEYCCDIDYDSGNLYSAFNDNQKSFAAEGIKAPVTSENLINLFKKRTLLAKTLLNNENIVKNDVKNAIENNNQDIGITDYSSYSSLTDTQKEIAVVYMINNYSSVTDIAGFRKLFTQAVAYAKSNGGSSGSSGSSGGGKTGGYSPAVTEKSDLYNMTPASDSGFSDIAEAEWAREAITKLASLKIVSGKGDNRFAPNDNITREEFVAIAVNAFQLTASDKEFAFADADKAAWYADAVKTAYSSGIISGISDELFGIGRAVTRQDMAVIIYRTAAVCKLELYTVYPDKTIKDAGNVSEYAAEAVDKMVKAGIINGDENGFFNPSASATRAEAVQIIYNVLFKK